MVTTPLENNSEQSTSNFEPVVAQKKEKPQKKKSPIIFVLWGIVSVALLAEYVLTTFDLQAANLSRQAMAASMDDPESEFEENENSEELYSDLQAKITKLQDERDALSTLTKDLSQKLAHSSPSVIHPQIPNSHSEKTSNSVFTQQESTQVNSSSTQQNYPKSPNLLGSIKGKIVTTNGGNYVAINLGIRDGIRHGTELSVFAHGVPIGTLTIHEVRDQVSGGRVTLDGGEAPHNGLEVGQ